MSNGHGTQVKKRNGSVEQLNLEKIHKVVEEACEGLGGGVSSSQVEMNSGIQLYDGITTDEIQEILIRSASDLISFCLLYTSPSPRDTALSRMPSSA